MINVNSFFEIGNGHNICDDYCFHESFYCGPDIHIAYLSDGCSGSQNTNIGSRLIVHYVKKNILNLIKNNINKDDLILFIEKLFKENTLKKVIEELQLNDTCLDATLWIILNINNKIMVFGWGDGNVICKRGDLIQITRFSFERSFPFYLNYFSDPIRLIGYNELNIERKIETFLYKMEKQSNGEIKYIDCGMNTSKDIPRESFYCNHPSLLDSPEFICVYSDGIETYNNEVVNMPQQNYNCLRHVEFKSFSGDFIEKRMKALSRRDKQNNINHFDDLSGIGIVNE